MWNEISFLAWIHHTLHALPWYSIIIVHQPSNFSYVSLPKYKSHLLLHCMVSRSQPQTYFQDFYLFCAIFLNKIFIVLYMQIFMHEQWEPGKQTLKDQVHDRIVHSSSICCYLGALASFKCTLYLCFCLTPSTLSIANFKLPAPTCNTERKTKTKMSGLFSLSETWQMKNRGREKTF